MSEHYRLLVADLDGTLLDSGGEVEGYLVDRIRSLERSGALFTISTGRLFPSLAPFAGQLGVTLPVMTSSGAEIRDPVSGSIVRRLPVPRQVVSAALGAADPGAVTRYLVLGDDLSTDALNDESPARYARLLGVPLKRYRCLEAAASSRPGDVLAVLARGNAASLDRLERELVSGLGRSARTLRPFPHLLEVLHPLASKGDALTLLCSMLRIPLSQTVAVGDGPGDVDMIRTAGVGAAVSNADRLVSAQADYVADRPGPAGVVDVIDRFFPGRKRG